MITLPAAGMPAASTIAPESLIPLSPAVFHILLVLAGGERHGYAMMQEVEANAQGRVKMGPGTLYGALKRMLAAGLIEACDARPELEVDDPRWRDYRLTLLGRRVLAAEAVWMARLAEAATATQVVGDYEGYPA